MEMRFLVNMPLTDDLKICSPEIVSLNTEDCFLIEGYAVTWDIDTANRRFNADSIKYNKCTPFFLEHNINMDIGVLTSLNIDDIGLYVKGYINAAYPGIDQIIRLFDNGYCLNLSIGGFIDDYYVEDGTMIVTNYKLIEVSLVSYPINKYAIITNLK